MNMREEFFALEHCRCVAFIRVQIDAFELAAFVGISYGAQAVLIDQSVLQLAVLLFAYAPVERIDQVFDLRAIGQGDQAQVAQAVVSEMGGVLSEIDWHYKVIACLFP